jgi:hypothetical protein
VNVFDVNTEQHARRNAMTKFIARIATGIAIIGLAAPAFATTTNKSMTVPAPTAQTSSAHHRHAHKKVASADRKEAGSKKVEEKGAVKTTTKAEKTAAPTATPVQSTK